MKKMLMLLTLFVGLVSCNDEVESNPNETNANEKVASKQTAGKGTLDPIVLEFEEDVLASNLQEEMINWKVAVDKRDFDELKKIETSINSIFNGFYAKYGKVEVIGYIEILKDFEVNGAHDGSPCTRNRNGTIYLGACSFWEKVQFFFSFACSGLAEIDAEKYADCLQEKICDICK